MGSEEIVTKGEKEAKREATGGGEEKVSVARQES